MSASPFNPVDDLLWDAIDALTEGHRITLADIDLVLTRKPIAREWLIRFSGAATSRDLVARLAYAAALRGLVAELRCQEADR
jgi:hypothetical protein